MPKKLKSDEIEVLAKQELGRAVQLLYDVYTYLELIAKDPLSNDAQYDLQQQKLLTSVGIILSLRVMRFLKVRTPS